MGVATVGLETGGHFPTRPIFLFHSASKIKSHGTGYAQGFKFRFDSHFGLDIETEYFVFRIVSVYHFGVHRIYIYIEYYIT